MAIELNSNALNVYRNAAFEDANTIIKMFVKSADDIDALGPACLKVVNGEG